MKKYICNPMNLSYKYQRERRGDRDLLFREAADPTMIRWKDRYLLFPSMSAGFWYSENLAEWTYVDRRDALPVFDYAPDVTVIGEWLYFCASRKEKGTLYRTKDPFLETFEAIEEPFAFWDPALV
ncbi:MAG: hypothetical protein SOZ59_00890 [Candidatus Limivivens sp.]|nr:hypothetical protein [Candidatus Limivivens sp.]